MHTRLQTFLALILAAPLFANAQEQPQSADRTEQQVLQSLPKTMSKASTVGNDLVESLVKSSQVIAGAQQIRSAFIWARTDNFEAKTLLDLVTHNYLKGVPPPFTPETRLEGSILRMSPASLPLCMSLEQKAGRAGTSFSDSSLESVSLYGCYLSNSTPVVFYRL